MLVSILSGVPFGYLISVNYESGFNVPNWIYWLQYSILLILDLLVFHLLVSKSSSNYIQNTIVVGILFFVISTGISFALLGSEYLTVVWLEVTILIVAATLGTISGMKFKKAQRILKNA